MIAQIEKQDHKTIEQYLELELNSQERHEYLDGEIVIMTGGTPNHNQIALNLSGGLNFALKRQPYRVFVTDQRLWIPQKQIYTYPDVMIIPGELQFQEGRKDSLMNPTLIAEVLSKSTEGYDRGDKFQAYRTISTFQEYLLIDQYHHHVEQFTKTDNGKWLLSEYEGETATLSLASVAFEISLADIYDKVDFTLIEQQ
ncbi:Uma2 family endonuclease [Planktothrix pseudagardhii]|uniref:Putative restriction endonuclease domain-containing protein n=1 Tax=Planktothrix pseudagardhii TaxID=132604 RepID=A0A9W4G361_9CYAN|nr:Uma2 family endonuclease [Planktothrix pseudagardhii]CAD5917754.1 putative protein sll1609 [Planktothrix pseudagardhii]